MEGRQELTNPQVITRAPRIPRPRMVDLIRGREIRIATVGTVELGKARKKRIGVPKQ